MSGLAAKFLSAAGAFGDAYRKNRSGKEGTRLPEHLRPGRRPGGCGYSGPGNVTEDRKWISDPQILDQIRGYAASPSWSLLGLRAEDAGPGWAKIRMPFDRHLLQPMGRVHGGFIAMLIDSAVAAALGPTLQEGQGMTTVDLKVNYVRPAFDQDLLAVARLRHRGRTTALADCSVIDAETQKEVAFGVALYMILSQP